MDRLDDLTVHDNAEERRYEARIGSKVVGVLSYQAEPGRLTLIHTEVDPAAEGKGVGSRLVAGALEDIRSRGLSLVPVCPFVLCLSQAASRAGRPGCRRMTKEPLPKRSADRDGSTVSI